LRFFTAENMEECLERISERIKDRDFDAISAQEKIDEAVWQNTYIPKRLDEVGFPSLFLIQCNFTNQDSLHRFVISSEMWPRRSRECSKISSMARSQV